MQVNTVAVFTVFTSIDSLAIILTVFRLAFRLRIQRFWWEDMWAAVTLICGITFVVGQMVAFTSVDYMTVVITNKIASLAFTSTVWAARMSLLYSTIRIISPSSILRKVTRILAVLFFLFWVITIVLKTYRCAKASRPTLSFGHTGMHSQCGLPEEVVYLELPSNCIADMILVYLSLKLLWRVKLPRRLRRMILCLSSSSAIMSISSVCYTICYIATLQFGRRLMLEIELTFALILCNLLVAVTYMYRVILASPSGSLPYGSESSSDEDDFTTPIRHATSRFTTVDLNVAPSTNDGNMDVTRTSTTLDCSSAA